MSYPCSVMNVLEPKSSSRIRTLKKNDNRDKTSKLQSQDKSQLRQEERTNKSQSQETTITRKMSKSAQGVTITKKGESQSQRRGIANQTPRTNDESQL